MTLRFKFAYLIALCTGWASEKWWLEVKEHEPQNYLTNVINYARL